MTDPTAPSQGVDEAVWTLADDPAEEEQLQWPDDPGPTELSSST